jgi:hypothetical protein
MIKKLCRSLLLHCLTLAFSSIQMAPAADEVAPEPIKRGHGLMEVIDHCGGHSALCMVGSR